ncbi:MAG: response regulator transcription factor [Firmicutes bacterium]|nr:response regulator transcription factor [Bacillota bacterium]
MNVVLIDNNIGILEELVGVVKGILPSSTISSFKDPMLAVKHVYNHATDIVISEVKTRPVSGFDVLRNLHKLRPEMLVVLLSDEPGHETKALEYGADGFLTQPVNPQELSELIDKLDTYKPLDV